MKRFGEMVLRFGKVLSSAVKGEGVVTVSIAGIGGITEDEGDEAGEANTEADVFGPLGDVARPLPPDDATGDYAEKISVKMHEDDEDTVISWRDLRLGKYFPNPKEGSIGKVHYGGGFWSFDMTDGSAGDQKGSVFTLYVPFQFSGGTPGKAHAIVLDAEQESIAIVHGGGVAITMKDDKVVIKNKAGDAYVEVNDDGITLNGNLKINGAVSLGNVAANFPLAKAPELIAWAALVSAAIVSLGKPAVPLSPSVATLLTKAS